MVNIELSSRFRESAGRPRAGSPIKSLACGPGCINGFWSRMKSSPRLQALPRPSASNPEHANSAGSAPVLPIVSYSSIPSLRHFFYG